MHPFVLQLSRTAHVVCLSEALVLLIGQNGLVGLSKDYNTYYLADEDAMFFEKRDLRLFREDVGCRNAWPKPRRWFEDLKIGFTPGMHSFFTLDELAKPEDE